MIGHPRWKAWLVGAHLLVAPACAAAQAPSEELETAVDQAKSAWIGHDYRALLAASDTVRLQLPGVGNAPSVRPSQAARVLEEYLAYATEVSFELRFLRVVNADHAYAEMVRVYVVRGTTDERVETVFLGFRRVDGDWRIREVRVAP